MNAENQSHNKRFNLPFFSFVPPWAPETQLPATFTAISSLIAPPSIATNPLAMPTASQDVSRASIPSSYGYITTTDNIIIPITGE
jgi:hypothetical protein